MIGLRVPNLVIKVAKLYMGERNILSIVNCNGLSIANKSELVLSFTVTYSEYNFIT